MEVDVLFVLRAVCALTLEGARTAKDRSALRRPREVAAGARLQGDGHLLEIQDFLKLLKSSGHVRLYACRLAALTFDVAPEDLLPQADVILDPGESQRSVAARADHCQYF